MPIQRNCHLHSSKQPVALWSKRNLVDILRLFIQIFTATLGGLAALMSITLSFGCVGQRQQFEQ